jgi:hypothetical protein
LFADSARQFVEVPHPSRFHVIHFAFRLRSGFVIVGAPMNCELAQKYWELGNAIVAFSVLQMLAFLYALAGKEFRRQIEDHYRFVQIGVLVGSVAYIVGVIGCYHMELDLRGSAIDPNVHAVLWETFWARIVVILLYAGLALGTMFAGRRYGWNRKEKL